MKKYIVNITNKALDDMKQIYHYIAVNLQSPDTALKQYDRIVNGIEKLDVFPERNRLIEFDFGNALEIRQLLVDNYSIFYTIKDDCVYVIRVLYSSSDLSRRLKEGTY